MTFHATYPGLCLRLGALSYIQGLQITWMEWCLLFPGPAPLLAHQHHLLGLVVQFHFITHGSQLMCKRALESFLNLLMLPSISIMGHVIMTQTETFIKVFNLDPLHRHHFLDRKWSKFTGSRLEDLVKRISVMDNQCWLTGCPNSQPLLWEHVQLISKFGAWSPSTFVQAHQWPLHQGTPNYQRIDHQNIG